MSPRLDLALDRESYMPGDHVKGTVTVTEGGKSRNLEVFVRYTEKTRNYSHRAVELSSGKLHTGDLSTGLSFPIEIALPENALPSYSTKHGELFWEVDIKSDEPGRDTHVRRRIEVRPPPG